MGAERKLLAKVEYVTDTDVGMYKIGELSGAFNETLLKDYVKKYGHKNICSQLAYMQFQVWTALREVNSERSENNKDVVENK